MLASSDRGGMRIQFSKNPFGKKRDFTGNLINTPLPTASSAPLAAPMPASAAQDDHVGAPAAQE